MWQSQSRMIPENAEDESAKVLGTYLVTPNNRVWYTQQLHVNTERTTNTFPSSLQWTQYMLEAGDVSLSRVHDAEKESEANAGKKLEFGDAEVKKLLT